MARLDVDVGIRNAGFRRGLDEMRADAARLKASLGQMFAGAVGVGSFVAGLKSALQHADDLKDLSEKFGVSTRSLQGFKNVLDENGASLEQFAGAMNKLEIARSKALQGDQALQASFQRLGVSVKELSSLSPDDLMLKIGGGSMDASQMVQILGKSSLDLRVALKAASEEGVDFGNIMSGHVVDSLARANDQINRVTNDLRNSFGAVVVWITDQLSDMGAAVFAGGDKLLALGKFAGQATAAIASGDLDRAKKSWATFNEEVDRATKNLAAVRAAEQAAKEAANNQSSSRAFDSEVEDGGEVAQKREDRIQKIREAEEEAARAALEGQEKINALMEERNRLLEIYKSSSDEDAGLDALEKAQRIQRQIESEEKKQGEEKKRREDEIATKRAEEAQAEVDREQRISAARKDEFQAREDDIISTLTGEDKIKALGTKLQRMQEEAGLLEGSDPEAAARKRTEMIGVSAALRDEKQRMKDETLAGGKGELRDAKDRLDRVRDAAASVPTDSLGAVGGGRGNMNSGPDAMIRVAERQYNVQARMLSELQAMNSKSNKKEADPWR